MLIKEGTRIKTGFCTGVVTKVIDGRDHAHMKDQYYYEVRIIDPKLHWRRRRQVIRLDEVLEAQ